MSQKSNFALRSEEGPLSGQEYELSKSIITLGREDCSEVDIVIPSPAISRRHARITRRGDEWFLEDLGSKNGTFLNDQAVQREPKLLKSGDRIRLGGEVRFIFQSALSKP